jgi:glycosyltransferase involved in cell wall biosynthesis
MAISSPGPKLDEFQAAVGVPVCPVPMARRIRPLADLASLFALWRAFRKNRPAIVHAHTPKAGLLAMTAAFAAGVKVRLYTIHGLPLVTHAGLQRRLLRWAEKLACALATGVYCVSRSVRDLAAAERIRPAAGIRVLGDGSCSGIDLERFDPARHGAAARREARARYGIPEEAVLIGYCGRLVRDKGIVELSEAWASLRDSFPAAHLLLCGDFEPQDPVPRPARRLLEADPRVHLTGGFVAGMPGIYAAMDLCVLPSYREGLSTVTLECAAMQTPMVATRIPGCVDLIEDGVTGLLVPPRDARALAQAIGRLIRNPDLGRCLASAARGFVAARYSEQRVSELLVDEYRRLLSPTGVAGDVLYAPFPTDAQANR